MDTPTAPSQTDSARRPELGDVLIGVGLALIVGGIGWYSPPAGVITAGLVCILLGVAWFRATAAAYGPVPRAGYHSDEPPSDGGRRDV